MSWLLAKVRFLEDWAQKLLTYLFDCSVFYYRFFAELFCLLQPYFCWQLHDGRRLGCMRLKSSFCCAALSSWQFVNLLLFYDFRWLWKTKLCKGLSRHFVRKALTPCLEVRSGTNRNLSKSKWYAREFSAKEIVQAFPFAETFLFIRKQFLLRLQLLLLLCFSKRSRVNVRKRKNELSETSGFIHTSRRQNYGSAGKCRCSAGSLFFQDSEDDPTDGVVSPLSSPTSPKSRRGSVGAYS